MRIMFILSSFYVVFMFVGCCFHSMLNVFDVHVHSGLYDRLFVGVGVYGIPLKEK